MDDSSNQQSCYQDVYQRKIDTTPIEQYVRIDPEWLIPYIEDFRCIDRHNQNIISETNLKFLKILRSCKIFFVDNRESIHWKNTIVKADIDNIVNTIEKNYCNDLFSDSDLHDDIFEHFGIISPITAHDQSLRKNFIEKNEHKFSSEKECKTFLKNRSKLFCLYIFLRRCAILYRDTRYKAPLQLLLNFLSIKNNLDSFKDGLRVKAVRFAGDYWGAGLHEWLTCESTIIALRRTAGLKDAELCPKPPADACIKPVNGKLSFKGRPEKDFIFSEFNWLDFQFLVRTETKYIIFSHNLNGHPGAVYKAIVPTKEGGTKGESQKTVWSPKFHDLINNKFNESRNIGRYMYEVASFYNQVVLHDKTPIFNLTRTTYYLVDGTRTDDHGQIRFFQQNKLKQPYQDVLIWCWNMLNQIELNQLDDGDKINYTYHNNNVFPTSTVIIRASNSVLTI